MSAVESASGLSAAPLVTVFMPSPILTITIEEFGGGREEHHIHAGGQGFWVARMIQRLGVGVCLAVPIGGDTGMLIRSMIEREGIDIAAVEVRAENGSYIDDRRGGDRVSISRVPSGSLSRHEIDDLYDATLVRALDSSVLVLTGPSSAGIIPLNMYTRLARDARQNGVQVVADLAGDALQAALEGGIDLLKVSHLELAKEDIVQAWTVQDIAEAARRLRAAGADNVVISQGDEPAVAYLGDEFWEVRVPRFEALDHRGAGDSMTAGIAAALARGDGWLDAIRLGSSAGALNVTRHGLGTGSGENIEQIRRHVTLRRLPMLDEARSSTDPALSS